MSSSKHDSADCCIIGGGPAGLMLAYLLARAGLQVVVLEKHADFLRDFRGDTIHPFTLQIMHHLGLLDALLTLPHQRVEKLQAEMGGEEVTMADFSRLPVRCRFIAFMPQWDFLNFLAEKSAQFSGFTLLKSTVCRELITENGQVCGVLAEQAGQPMEIRARLVVGADGRDSVIRAQAGLSSQHFGAPRDVLWFHLNKQPDDPLTGMGHTGPRNNFIVIDRGITGSVVLPFPKASLRPYRHRGWMRLKTLLRRFRPLPLHVWRRSTVGKNSNCCLSG